VNAFRSRASIPLAEGFGQSNLKNAKASSVAIVTDTTWSTIVGTWRPGRLEL
jgi:hypothetical protein